MPDYWLEQSQQKPSPYLALITSATYGITAVAAEALLRFMQEAIDVNLDARLESLVVIFESLQCERIKTRKKSQVYLITHDSQCWVLADVRSLEILAAARLQETGIVDDTTTIIAEKGLGQILDDNHATMYLFSAASVIFGFFQLR